MAAQWQVIAEIIIRLAAACVLLTPALLGCKVPPSQARVLLVQGVSMLEEGQYFLADLCLEDALDADSTLVDAWYFRGVSFADQDQPTPADSCFARALSLNAVHRPSLFTRGQLRLQRGDIHGAMYDFCEIAFLYPRFPDGYQGRAWVFERLGQIEEAIDQWQFAISVAPDNAPLYQERGFALLRAARPEPAVLDFSRALLLDSSLSQSHAGRGEARYLLGLFSLAVADCDTALAIDAEDAEAWLTRGRAADYSGLFEVAVDSYRRFLHLVPESDPDVPAVKLRLGRLDR